MGFYPDSYVTTEQSFLISLFVTLECLFGLDILIDSGLMQEA